MHLTESKKVQVWKPGKRPNKREESGSEISLAVEKLVKERLGLLEDAVLLGNKLYKKPTSEEAELYLHDKAIPQIHARIALEKGDVELGESFHLGFELQNVGNAPVLLGKVEEAVPNGFELVAYPDTCDLMSTYSGYAWHETQPPRH